ncbi:HNH endonuclease [Mycolicibacterium insubricum]|nr:HNH endonuclease [Mycolicibacterium insubricum]
MRARLRKQFRPCHICGRDIDYTVHYLDPGAFQVDHLLPVSLGGPADDWDNVDASHRACNRTRSNTIDAKAAAAAAHYGIPLADTAGHCRTDGSYCNRHGGTHPVGAPGLTILTTRKW